MKPLVTLALACALFSGVYALKCYKCVPSVTGPCSSETTCPANQTVCGSTTVATYIEGILKSTVNVMTCSAPAECVNQSLNIGISRTTVNTRCCETSLCNAAQVPELPGSSSPNGKKCFTCVGLDCTHTLECIGSEDRCIKYTDSIPGNTVIVKGCASHSICSLSKNYHNFHIGNLKVDQNCCEGNMCNNALPIGKSVLFLFLVPLASFILFN